MAIVRKSFEQVNQTPINERLDMISDNQIDYSDIPPLTDEQIAGLKDAKTVFAFMSDYKPKKQQITIRLDSDIIAWLKKDGKGYQTKANELLRKLMLNDIIHA